MATNISVIREAIKTQVETTMPGVFDAIYFFDGDPFVAAQAGLVTRGETALTVQLLTARSDNLTGTRRSRAIFHDFSLNILVTTTGKAGLNTAIKALDDIANDLHGNMQPNTFEVTTDIADGAHVETGDLTPISEGTLDFIGHSVPVTIRTFS